VVADLADTVAVMHHGRIVERAAVRELFASPREEYTRTLLAAVPHLGRSSAWTALAPEAQQALTEAEPLVTARDLVIEYPGRLGRAPFRAVKGVDFEIRAGEVFGLVGESGSGKTTIGRAIAGLERTGGGSLSVLGHEMNGLRERDFTPVRRRIGFVFQDPATSFNPHLTIEQCIAEPLVVHEPGLGAADRTRRVRELLAAVELPGDYAGRYPHELSGGQRQRVSLARALVLGPELLIADEPTSALDVSVQATVLALFRELQERLGFAALFISHDLAVVDSLAHRIGVLYRGELVEQGHGPDVLQRPQHEYTRRLIASLPVPDPVEQARRREQRRGSTA
jgi:peptide/nickel transport system ATP-binding protein